LAGHHKAARRHWNGRRAALRENGGFALTAVRTANDGAAMAQDAERVIVVGAGPVGLGAALELARFGLPSVVVERHGGTSWHPKTRNLNTRTMEIARGWGPAAYKRLCSIDTPDGWKSPIRFMASALGEEHGQIETLGFVGPGPDISPAQPVMSSQELIEEIMLGAARATGLVEVRFRTEAVRLLEGGGADDQAARLEVRDLQSGVVETLTAPALVAADGAFSPIREQLGLRLEGRKDLSHIVNCYFRADIEPRLGERRGVLFFVSNERARGVLQPLDAAGRWLCQINVRAEDWSAEAFTKDRARDWIRAAVGAEDLEPQVLSLGFWKLNATVVERLVQGRVVLCGDAAHQFPPTGGLGVNTGLQGMHNAMWKLALCVKGQAGWPLLETYDDERRGVAQAITQQSLQNSINVGRIQAAAAGGESGLSAAEIVTASRRYGNHLGVEFGAAYASAAVVPDGTQPPQVADSYSDYVQTATPGCRAPHVWLGRPEAQLSTLDLIGPGFTLLAASGADGWAGQAARAAEALGVRIDVYRIGDGAGLGDDGRFAPAYGLEGFGAVLIRPDGYVGWRGAGAPGTGAELAGALRQILAR
jgi:2-polyprenyl-6-methoxyphenol hydroxylase-like FAD-dependent oxidoreductase